MATVLAVAAMLPASADVRIRSSPGGAVEAYLAAFARVRQSGQRVVIDGPCLSACTLVLSTIPRNHVGNVMRRIPSGLVVAVGPLLRLPSIAAAY